MRQLTCPFLIQEGIEKGVDVALSIAVGNKAQSSQLDLVILLTDDSDYTPLIHNLKKKGVNTITINFENRNPAVALRTEAFYSATYGDLLEFAKKKGN